MKFLITGTNYVGTPKGYLELASHEDISNLYTLQQAEWVEVKETDINPSELYQVHASDTGFYVSLLKGGQANWPGGQIFNARVLGDGYFNGQFYPGNPRDCHDTPKENPKTLDQVWGPNSDPNKPWYKKGWEARDKGILEVAHPHIKNF